jgi:hypothetical protein
MRMLKVIIVALAALFAVSTVQAATFVKPSGNAGVESSVVLTKGKKAKSKAGKCGTFMYYKTGKCEDARLKK